jgi:hypothetical protein
MDSSENLPEFGRKRANEVRRDGGCAVVFDPETQKYAIGKQFSNGFFRLFSGGVADGEDIKEGILREVVEESGLHDFLYTEKIAKALTHYYNSLRKVNRVGLATCLLVILKSTKMLPVHLEAHEKFTLEWATAGEILYNWEKLSTKEDVEHWVYFFKKAVTRVKQLGYDTTSQT